MRLEEVYKDLDILDKSEKYNSFSKTVAGVIDNEDEMEKIYHIPEENISEIINEKSVVVGFVDSKTYNNNLKVMKELKISKDYIKIYITDDKKVFDLIKDADKMLVKDLNSAQLVIGNYFYDNPAEKLKFIGAVGSKGLEETTMMLKGVLDEADYTTGLIGSVYGVIDQKIIFKDQKTLSMLNLIKVLSRMLNEEVSYVIFELNNSFIDLAVMLKIHFEKIIYTNFSREKELSLLDEKLSLDEKEAIVDSIQEKREEVLSKSGKAYINVDDFLIRKIKKAIGKGKYSTFGIANEADYNAVDINIKNTGTTLITFLKEKAYRMNSQIILPNAGYYILAVVSLSYEMEISPAIISKGMDNIVVKGKMELVQNQAEVPVVIEQGKDLKQFNSTMKLLRNYVSGRLLTIYGYDGDLSEEDKQEMARILGKFSDFVTVTTGMSKNINPKVLAKELFKKLTQKDVNTRIILDRKYAIEQAMSHADRKDMVVLVGLGRENFLILKDSKVPFNERKIVNNQASKLFIALQNNETEKQKKEAENLLKKFKGQISTEDDE